MAAVRDMEASVSSHAQNGCGGMNGVPSCCTRTLRESGNEVILAVRWAPGWQKAFRWLRHNQQRWPTSGRSTVQIRSGVLFLLLALGALTLAAAEAGHCSQGGLRRPSFLGKEKSPIAWIDARRRAMREAGYFSFRDDAKRATWAGLPKP